MKRKDPPKRAEGNTSITFSCTETMRDRIDEAAERDYRDRTSWIRLKLREALAAEGVFVDGYPGDQQEAEARLAVAKQKLADAAKQPSESPGTSTRKRQKT